jgi:predicted PurR-regulated permease PerM
MTIQRSPTRTEYATSRVKERWPVPAGRTDLARTVLAVLLLMMLIAGSFWILRPFLLSMLWAMTIVVATWPMMLSVQARLRRRSLAVTVMTATMFLLFVAPVLLTVRVLVENTATITGWVQAIGTGAIPPPPQWVDSIPLAGPRIAERWAEFAASGQEDLAARIAPYVSDVLGWLPSALGGAGALVIQLFLTIVISAILYAKGEAARDALLRFGRRLAAERGEQIVVLAGQSIRAVALGVVVTALVQTVLSGVGLGVAGIPFAALLTAIVLVLCIAQIGPLVVLIPAVVWLFWTDQTGWGIALLVWSIVVGLLDNVLRPILIRRGADLPLLLIFAGVIGGLLSFGIVGLFVGPVVLAVAYTLLKQWVNERPVA